ncbi:Coenzyme F420 hydrogenase/dehydrogenase, beta subunit C-terminal domain [Sphingomonas dokdonensis]|uniref:Coenzyme F420-reducing hydrogenase subunit beta n=1 Tax=Sphingomonas dokdonensis TaxID=344880 RepID=A0A245ZGB1_9SPHN|nr:Coenzyme F420 hydrogenase/dehydrogenase, beta subunit C-terminal domain [Sphingomonas dokdonensis]OWK28779.1 coenzyme F420-reducing hydrogenase subunit beta [Sphingomonas dokdonensis]
MPSPDALTPADIAASGLCIGCGGCATKGMAWDRYGQRKPSDATLADYRHDGPVPETDAPHALPSDQAATTFAATCPFSPTARNEDQLALARFPHAPHHDARLGRYEANYVGHAEQAPFRERGSSGGMVSWVAADLLASGKIDGVAHVIPATGDRLFHYRISRTEGEILEGARSRYYPVDLAEVLAEIRATPGRYAIVGIPCFIKAVSLLREQDPVLRERITHLLGLFCGHMKSAQFVDSFAWQLDVPRQDVRAVEYRRKDPDRPANWYTAHLTLSDGTARWQDWFHLADGDWGAGFFQNSACDACDDVVAECADVSFGDAWVEPYSSDGRGTNVVVVRSPEIAASIAAAIDNGRLDLKAVDADFIANTQAAGFRQRRDGLAYRLTWQKRRVTPVKRVAPRATGHPPRRRAIYRTRAAIAWWSHRMAWAANRLRWPALYTRWARASLYIYQALAYKRGRLGRWLARLDGVEG